MLDLVLARTEPLVGDEVDGEEPPAALGVDRQASEGENALLESSCPSLNRTVHDANGEWKWET